jgi:hypothetical protein
MAKFYGTSALAITRREPRGDWLCHRDAIDAFVAEYRDLRRLVGYWLAQEAARAVRQRLERQPDHYGNRGAAQH